MLICPAGMRLSGAEAMTALVPSPRRIGPMTKLTDTQLVLLSAAAQRDDHLISPPENLKGAAARKVGTSSSPLTSPRRSGSASRIRHGAPARMGRASA
jgi:hypothetical protein